MKAEIIAVGTEILTGQIVETPMLNSCLKN